VLRDGSRAARRHGELEPRPLLQRDSRTESRRRTAVVGAAGFGAADVDIGAGCVVYGSRRGLLRYIRSGITLQRVASGRSWLPVALWKETFLH